MTTDDWAVWRQARPEPAVLHLDAAAAGRSSQAVLDAVADHARREATEGAYVAFERASSVIDELRNDLAELFGLAPSGVVFVESATVALSTALRVAGPAAGSTVAVAPSEWGPNLHAFAGAGLERRVLEVDGRGVIDLDALATLLAGSPPAFVHVTHQVSHRAVRQPADDIARICRDAGVPLWVDAAQALGHADVDYGADVIYAPSRKWLTGPRGVGLLAFNERCAAGLRLDAEPAARPGAGPLDGIESHEAHVAGRVGLRVAVADVMAFGVATISARLDKVGRMTREILGDVPGWKVVDPIDAPGAITAIAPTDGQDVFAERARLLGEHGIVTTACATARAPLDMKHPLLRVSPHVDVVAGDIERLAGALELA